MKWTLIALLGGLLAWSVAAYRLSPDADGEGRVVLTWVSDDNPARRGTIELFERLNPDLRVVLDPANTGLEKIIVQCKGGIGPDVFNVYGRWQLLDYVRTGVPLPLDEYAGALGIDAGRTWAEVLEEISVRGFDAASGKYERVQYTFPANVNANVMFFNKRLFDEAGVAYPEGEWTWEAFLAVAKRLTRRGPDGRVQVYGLGTYEYLDATELIWQFGGDLFDETGTYCVLDSPEAQGAMRFLHRMFVIEEVMPSLAERDAMATAGGGFGGGQLDLFGQGRLAMIPVGRWALVVLRKYPDLAGRLGAVQMPYAREKVTLCRAMSVGVNRNGPNREAALRFLQFLASEAFSWQVVASGDALPPSPAVAGDARFLRNPDHPKEDFNEQFVIAMHRGRNQGLSPFVQIARVERAINRQLTLLAEDKVTPEQACRRLTDEINTDIETSLVRYASMREEYERRTGTVFSSEAFPPRREGRSEK